MDFQFWLYIVIGVIWFLSRILKKPEQQTPPTDLPDFNPAKPVRKFEEGNARPAPQKALTFEELLREITEQKATQQPKSLKLEDTPVHYGKFKGFQQEQQRDLVGTYLADFRDREGLKKAVVMSEILQRKF